MNQLHAKSVISKNEFQYLQNEINTCLLQKMYATKKKVYTVLEKCFEVIQIHENY